MDAFWGALAVLAVWVGGFAINAVFCGWRWEPLGSLRVRLRGYFHATSTTGPTQGFTVKHQWVTRFHFALLRVLLVANAVIGYRLGQHQEHELHAGKHYCAVVAGPVETIDDANTGMFHSAPGVTSFACNGVEVARCEAPGIPRAHGPRFSVPVTSNPPRPWYMPKTPWWPLVCEEGRWGQ